MKSFLRPEIIAMLTRWREVIALVVIIALGVWIAFRPGGFILSGFGWVLAAAAAAILVPAIRRARFASAGDGPGVVAVDEGRVSYMGPQTGGTMALDDLNVLSVRHDRDGQTAWVLADETQLLVIPVDAAGADALFDAFAALPGMNIDRVIGAVRSRTRGSQRLWARDAAQATALTP